MKIINHATLIAWFGSLNLVSLIRFGYYRIEKKNIPSGPGYWGNLYTAGLML